MSERVGFIGMGIMGSPMAINLAKAGFDVTVYNRTADKCREAVAAGAKQANSSAEVFENCNLIWLMLSNDAAVMEVIANLLPMQPAKLVVDSSTVHPDTSRRVAAMLRQHGALFLDAPVTGSKPQAEAGKLFFLVGGPEAAYHRAISFLEKMGRRHLYLGETGMGACAKLCNNLMGFINLSGLCEGMAIAQAFGLEPQKLFDVISDSGGRSAISDVKGPKLLRADWKADFALALAHKDLELARRLAAELNRSAPVTGAAAHVFGAAKQAGEGGNDVAALYKWYVSQRA